MGRLLARALQDPVVRQAALEAMCEMGADPRVGRALAETARLVVADEGTQHNLGSLARTTARDVSECVVCRYCCICYLYICCYLSLLVWLGANCGSVTGAR